jgi:hypothetical protein
LKTINLFLLIQALDSNKISDFENALSGRKNIKNCKMEELTTVAVFVDELIEIGAKIKDLESFFYSFTIPQISKEFDLIKVYKDDLIVNIELKSEMTSEERIEKQLLQNKYYLKHIASNIFSFTYIKSEDGGIVYSIKDNKLCLSSMDSILKIISRDENCITGDIEKLFRPKDYLISPLNTPNKFILGKYYLTCQQEEIKNKICKGISEETKMLWGITGSAGTGKTLLLYDIAVAISYQMSVCIIHSGVLSEGHIKLNSIFTNIDIISVKDNNKEILRKYDCVFVDEAQRLYQGDFDIIIGEIIDRGLICVFSYDYRQTLSKKEERRNIPFQLNSISGFIEEILSEKIRTNKETASFITNMINLNHKPKSYVNYDNIDVIFAEDYDSARKIVRYYTKQKDYKFISYTPSKVNNNKIDTFSGYDNTHHIIGQEFDNVIFSMDKNFRYDEHGGLQGKIHPNPDYVFYKLWYQGVTRAREKLCILIIENRVLFEQVLSIKTQFIR